LIETEHAVGAAIDYLETRPDIDAERIGVMGLSLGGYYAPRAAAFEPRIKACLCWGAVWDFGERWHEMVNDSKKFGSIPDMLKHAMWVFGKKDVEGVLAFGSQIRCQPFADKIRCDLYILHGENDRQVPLRQAELLYAAAANAKSRTMRVFKIADGGAEHCQFNNRTLAADALADYAAEKLGGEVNGVQ
jgi:dipeptidyl aminopeptidase/acylaminoacyl peptidase